MADERLDGFERVTEWLQDAPTVETVYGDPVAREDRTVVPVATVRYRAAGGFGWGAEGGDTEGDGGGSGGGGGGTGSAQVTPIGALEVRDDGTEFVRFDEGSGWGRVLFVGVVGLVLGVLLGRGRAGD